MTVSISKLQTQLKSILRLILLHVTGAPMYM